MDDIRLVERRDLISRKERLIQNVTQVDKVKNTQGIIHYDDMFYAIKDLTEQKILKK